MNHMVKLLFLSLLFCPVSTAWAGGGWLGLFPDVPKGIRVGEVIKESPADKAGLLKNDLVVAVQGQEIQSIQQFGQMIVNTQPGKEVLLTVLRAGQKIEVKAVLEDAAAHPAFPLYPQPGTPPRPAPPVDKDAASTSHLTKAFDHQAQLNSARSLLEAFRRISAEKNIGEPARQTEIQIKALLDKAEEHFKNGRMDEGHRLTDQAYEMSRIALDRLRGGETLYLPLRFTSKEEEYVYELDRNDAFQMLTRQFVTDPSGGNLDPGVGKEIENSLNQRKKGEAEAAAGQFDAAVKTMESATEILIKLLKEAGLQIPG